MRRQCMSICIDLYMQLVYVYFIFIIEMFKKRGAPKGVNINDMLTQINTSPQNQPVSRTAVTQNASKQYRHIIDAQDSNDNGRKQQQQQINGASQCVHEHPQMDGQIIGTLGYGHGGITGRTGNSTGRRRQLNLNIDDHEYVQYGNQNRLQKQRAGTICGSSIEVEQQKQIQTAQIQKCFQQLRQMHKLQMQIQKQQQAMQDTRNYMGWVDSNEQDDNLNYHIDELIQIQPIQYSSNDNKMPVIHQVLIQDQSNNQVQCLQYEQDNGELSSDMQNSENEYGYQNQIIKQTLTRSNYQKIQHKVKSTHLKSYKNKLLQEIDKISYAKLRSKIGKDLRAKTNHKKQLIQEIKYIDNKIKVRNQEIAKQLQGKEEVEAKLDRVRRMLEMLYYFGSELFDIQDITQQSLQGIVYEEQWKDKIDRVRAVTKRNKQEWQRNRKNKLADQQQGQQNRGDKSQGDVEEIPKHKFEEGWDGWPVDDEQAQMGGEMEKKGLGYNDREYVNDLDDDVDDSVQIDD